jgi:hypothetical protein
LPTLHPQKTRNSKETENIRISGKIRHRGGGNTKGISKSEIATDNDKNHFQWHAKNGEDFAKVFY